MSWSLEQCTPEVLKEQKKKASIWKMEAKIFYLGG